MTNLLKLQLAKQRIRAHEARTLEIGRRAITAEAWENNTPTYKRYQVVMQRAGIARSRAVAKASRARQLAQKKG
jgi:hypothetical protein